MDLVSRPTHHAIGQMHLGMIAKLFRLCAGLIGVYALALQYWVIGYNKSGQSLITWTINFFSFFTILVNTLAALAMLWPVLAPRSRMGQFLVRPSTRAAITVYIIVVSGVYHFVLRPGLHTKGFELIADSLLHYATPTFFVADWFLNVPKGSLRWKSALAVLIFPGIYIVWTLAHGEATGWYPYPFANVRKLGLDTALTNAGGLLVVFFLLQLLAVGVDRVMSKRIT